jgi:ABC-type phosphate transport system permease subunit
MGRNTTGQHTANPVLMRNGDRLISGRITVAVLELPVVAQETRQKRVRRSLSYL